MTFGAARSSHQDSGEHGALALSPTYRWPDDAYPAVLAGAEIAAREGRVRYTRLSRTELLLIVTVAALVVTFTLGEDRLWTTDTGNRALVRILLPVLLVSAFIAKIANRVRDYRSQWFQSRAIAEAVKSSTWLYVTRASPFQGEAIDTEADQAFDQAIRETVESAAIFHTGMYRSAPALEQITPAMRAQRTRSLELRQQLYLAARIDDQIRWYRVKSDQSNTLSARWFRAGVIVQGILVAAAVVAVEWLALAVFIGFFATASTATSALSKLGRHDDIRKSYVLAANELELLRDKIAEAKSEDALSERIEAAENAISHEHGMWIARR